MGPHTKRMFGCFGLIGGIALLLFIVVLSQYSPEAPKQDDETRHSIALCRESLIDNPSVLDVGAELSAEREDDVYKIRLRGTYRRADGGVEGGVLVCRVDPNFEPGGIVHGKAIRITFE